MRIPHLTRRRTIVATALVGGVAAVFALAGCAASAASGSDTSATPQARGQNSQNSQNAGDRGGVSGLIAAVSDGVLQVQGDGQQTAVRYTDDTTVRRTSAVKASTIAVGDCVVAMTAQDADAATTVTVTEAASDGTCTTGFGGGRGGARPSGAPTGMPQDGNGGRGMPSGAPEGNRPSGAPTGGAGGGFGQMTSGAVTAATSTSLTVETTSADGSTSSEKVTLSADTTVTATKDATAADIAEGLCVRATGKADDKGGYDATELTLSDASSDGTCTTGFGGPGGGQAPGAGSGNTDD